VIGVTAALASYAPPISAQSGPFSAENTFGPIQLEISVEPARVGANQIHIYMFDAKSGAPYAKAKQVKASASLPEKSISLPLEPQLSGPGNSGTSVTSMAFSTLSGINSGYTSSGAVIQLGTLLDTVTINARVVNTQGFRSGTYQITSTVTCQQ